MRFPSKHDRIRIGMVVAVEINSLIMAYGPPKETTVRAGFKVLTYEHERCDIFAISSGAGEICAAAATQLLITAYDVDMILNFGVVGALTEDMRSADLCIVDRVVHYAFDAGAWLGLPLGRYPDESSIYQCTNPELAAAAKRALPHAPFVTLASADRFLDAPEDKRQIAQDFSAQICDMEGAAIVRTSLRAEVPSLLIKAVADSLIGGNKEFSTELVRASNRCMDAVDTIIKEL